MSRVTCEAVAAELGTLQERTDYKKLTDPAVDDRCKEFRQVVEQTIVLCFQLPPDEATDADVRHNLAMLVSFATGKMTAFRSAIEKAQKTLDGSGRG